MTSRWSQHPYPPSAHTPEQDARQRQGSHRRWSSYSPGGNHQSYPQAQITHMYRQPYTSYATMGARPVSMFGGPPLSSLSPYARDKGPLQQHMYQQPRSSVGYATRPALPSPGRGSSTSLQPVRRAPRVSAHGRSASLSGFSNGASPYSLLNNRRLSAPAIHAIVEPSKLLPRVNANILRKQTYLNPRKDSLSWSTGFDYLACLTDPYHAGDLSNQTSAKAFLSRFLKYIRQSYDTSSNTRAAPSSAISKMNQVNKLHKAWLPKGTVHASKIHFASDRNTFAGHIDFEDSSSVWWRCKWPTSTTPARRSSMSMSHNSQAEAGGSDAAAVLPGFEALIADPFERQDPGVAEKFAKTIGTQIAQMASDISGGPQVAAPNGKDKGICRAIPMLLFHKLRLAWTQWGCKRFESTIQNGQRKTVYQESSPIEPGCIVFMRNISMKMLHIDKNGKVVRRSDYKVDGQVGHIATVVGCGYIASLAGKGTTYAERAVLFPSHEHLKTASQSTRPFEPANLGWLKIVEQALGENGSADITPRTVLLDMSTFGGKNQEMTIYLPMWQARDVKRVDVGSRYPVSDGREWTHIRGLQQMAREPAVPRVVQQVSKYATTKSFQPVQMQTGHPVKRSRRNSLQSILSVFT